MFEVLTGDIINSQKAANPAEWLVPLKNCLGHYGAAGVDWEVYRGDSFQLVPRSSGNSLRAAFHLKATLKGIDGLDVRLAIGLGDASFVSNRVMESTGEAYMRSGRLLDSLKSSGLTLGIRTDSAVKDEWFGSALALAAIIADGWSPNTARVIAAQLDFPNDSQVHLAQRLGISQAAVSKALKRGHFSELIRFADLLGKIWYQ